MSTPTFSICHATLGRPEKAVAAMRMWFDRADRPQDVEYIFACNCGDPSAEMIQSTLTYTNSPARVIMGDFPGSAAAWDAAAKVSTGTILIQAQDDVEPPKGWDTKLMLSLADYSEADTEGPFMSAEPSFIAVSDGYRKDAFCFMAIMSRAYYEQKGEFIHPGYLSVFSDDDVYYRAKRDSRDGRCTLIEARDLVFLHRHHYHDPAVPHDATYAKENSSEAYAQGAALFAQRNPEAATDGLKDWN